MNFAVWWLPETFPRGSTEECGSHNPTSFVMMGCISMRSVTFAYFAACEAQLLMGAKHWYHVTGNSVNTSFIITN